MTENRNKALERLKGELKPEEFEKLAAIDNPDIHDFVLKYLELCKPGDVFVSTGSGTDIQYIREMAVGDGEEKKLALEGQTIHFDGIRDQARDRKNTNFLMPRGKTLGLSSISGEVAGEIDRDEALEEIHGLLDGIMKGHRLYVLFMCLGPAGSDFSILGVQLTDSAYVAHNENLLYRQGYKEFLKSGKGVKFFRFVHSAGELENHVCKNVEKRRIYIDLEDEIVYSVNTQYGGNTIGLKKLAMRPAILRASKEGWLTEHMFVMGVHGPGGRVSYYAGAFPSLCGKTSTSMMNGETIVGDDIAYLRERDGYARAVNVEQGMFGIIQGVNPNDDPILWEVLNKPGEIIFSNVLMTGDGEVHWIGKEGLLPEKGINYAGEWHPGKKDDKGKEIPPSHKNARFTLDMHLLKNVDQTIDDPKGVKVDGIIYGGRDSNICVPVEESFDWVHGVITKGASLESEGTAAVLGKEGTREFNPMANLDFLSIPLAEYVGCHLKFGEKLKKAPKIFSVNYFLKGPEGDFLSEKDEKAVWLKWMELRSHGDVGALKTPTGLIPKYGDLKELFKRVLGKDYPKRKYVEQFKLRIPEHLAKVGRVREIYKTKVVGAPDVVFKVLDKQEKRLSIARDEFGDCIPPEKFPPVEKGGG